MREYWRSGMEPANAMVVCALFALVLFGPMSAARAAPLPMYFDRFDRDSGLSQLTVNTIAQDPAGFLWVGTEDGFERFDGYLFRHAGHDLDGAASLPSSYVASIQRDVHGALWLATDGGGVMRRDPSTGGL